MKLYTNKNLPDKYGASELEKAVVDIRESKRDRSNAKRTLTKKQNEIKELMTGAKNASEIKQRMQDLEIIVLKPFINPHKALNKHFHEEEDIQ